jgi:multidrug efflux pump subunit AcrB
MSLPSLSVKNQVLVNMMMFVILVGGSVFASTLVREMFPESRPDKLRITAKYLGVQPQEIEKAVTIKIEDAVHDVEGVEKVESTVQEGFSTTIVTLLNEVDDADAVLQEVKNKIDAIEDLPDDLNQVTVKKLVPQLPVISVAIFGEGSEADLKRAVRDLHDGLRALPGVSEVKISGTRVDEISVDVRPEQLLKYDITFAEVADAIRQTNLDVSGGTLKGDRTLLSLRTMGEENRGRDLEDIVIRSEPDGRKIILKDVAEIRDEFDESDLESYFNGKPAAHCIVYKTASQDVIQISRLVKAFIAGKQNEPFDAYGFAAAAGKPWYLKPFSYAGAGMSWLATKVSGRPDPREHYEASRLSPFDHNYNVALHTDLARFVEGRLDLLTRNGKIGLILVLISLNLFLNWRVAFWAAVGLPVSFLGTFVVMWSLGATINLLSMFGLIIVLGIIVDDAIVIGENIYRHVEEGMPPLQAAVKGAEEVMWPVTVAVATTIAAFAPLFFVKGQIGDFMGQLPIVVLAALTVSLIEALIILPAHLAHLPSKKEMQERAAKPPRFGRLTNGFRAYGRAQERLMRGTLPGLYERFLRFALRWRYATLGIGCATLLMSFGLFQGGIVESVFIQKMDSETLVCGLEMPVGTTAANTKKQLEKLSQFATSQQMPEVKSVQMFVARQYDLSGAGMVGSNDQSHLGQLVIELKPADERERNNERSSEELTAAFRQASQELHGVNSVTWEAMQGGPGGKDIHIQISGKDFEEIIAVSQKLKTELRGYKGVFDIDDNFDRGKREIQVRLRESARPTGITVGMLGNHIRAAMYGHEARRLTRNREDVKIMVRYPKIFRKNLYNLESMWIPTAYRDGKRGWVPVGQVAETSESVSYSTVHRSQQQRSITVYGDIDQAQGSMDEILAKIRETFATRIKPVHPGVQIKFLGAYEELGKAFGGLKLAFPVALLLIYMLLAGLFRSYFQPLVVMAAIPFGFQGAIFGHWITGNPFTILSWIGLVALMGILVNDALVLVDFINSRVRRGMDHFEASIQGAKLRLRAILLTTLTTVAGLAPLMFETSFQAKFLIPMAVTLTFGLVFATALTLVVVPALNMVYFDFVNLFSRKQALTSGEDDEPNDDRPTPKPAPEPVASAG